jgi:hypothetical protein
MVTVRSISSSTDVLYWIVCVRVRVLYWTTYEYFTLRKYVLSRPIDDDRSSLSSLLIREISACTSLSV